MNGYELNVISFAKLFHAQNLFISLFLLCLFICFLVEVFCVLSMFFQKNTQKLSTILQKNWSAPLLRSRKDQISVILQKYIEVTKTFISKEYLNVWVFLNGTYICIKIKYVFISICQLFDERNGHFLLIKIFLEKIIKHPCETASDERAQALVFGEFMRRILL